MFSKPSSNGTIRTTYRKLNQQYGNNLFLEGLKNSNKWRKLRAIFYIVNYNMNTEFFKFKKIFSFCIPLGKTFSTVTEVWLPSHILQTFLTKHMTTLLMEHHLATQKI